MASSSLMIWQLGDLRQAAKEPQAETSLALLQAQQFLTEFAKICEKQNYSAAHLSDARIVPYLEAIIGTSAKVKWYDLIA